MADHITNINAVDPKLVEYRVGKLEEAVATLSDALATLSNGVAEITQTLRSARMVVLILFGFVQPVILAASIHYLIEG